MEGPKLNSSQSAVDTDDALADICEGKCFRVRQFLQCDALLLNRNFFRTTLKKSYNKTACVLTVVLLMELLSLTSQIPVYTLKAWASWDFP